jgi:hypothetical protein
MPDCDTSLEVLQGQGDYIKKPGSTSGYNDFEDLREKRAARRIRRRVFYHHRGFRIRFVLCFFSL